MKDSKIKKSIGEVIGEEQWLTDRLVTKIASKKRKSNKSFIKALQPVFVLLVIGLIGSFSYLSMGEQSVEQPASFSEVYFNKLLSEQQAEGAIAYLTAIEWEDYEAFEKVSATEVVASPKEVFQKYANVDFASLRILKMMPPNEEGITKLYMQHENLIDGQTYIHDLNIQMISKSDVRVYEDVYEEWLLYEPYVAPKSIALTYREAPVAETAPNGSLHNLMVAHGTLELPNGVQLWPLIKEENVQLYLIDGEHIVDLGYIGPYDKNADQPYHAGIHSFSNGDEVIVFSSFEDKQIRYVYYNEQLDAYQYVEGVPGEYTGGTMYNREEIGEELLFLEGENGQIVTVKDGKLIHTFIENHVEGPAWLQDFLSVEFLGGNFRLSYSEEFFQKTYYYNLNSLEQAVKQ
ncbi:hypothetical protein [Solibacillus sp. FSL H8-0538]|uniref:hypothetical protein n=1 Tax=Solibacillus sp. FSL H8-0538 TaxID=2921400 RepID=UPI0030F57BE1